MPEHASRFAGLYDQQNENRIADWGGDELFTRMPRRPVVDNAPAPRFRPALMLVEAPEERRHAESTEDRGGSRDRRAGSPESAMRERAGRRGLSVVQTSHPLPVEDAASAWDAPADADVVAPPGATVRRWDGIIGPPPERAANGRRTTVITGRPDRAPRPLSVVPAARRRPARTPAEWIGPRPERIVAWAFVLGLLLILIAISTADAATL